jgi:hypothetical protein
MPATAATQVFTSIRTVGGLLPADMLRRIQSGIDVSASTPADYHVIGVRSVKDAAERHWDFLKGLWRLLRSEIDDGGDPSGLTQENWLLPLFEEHGYGRLERVPSGGIVSDDGTTQFPVTHQWRHLPVHLAPWSLDLDKRPVGGGLPPQSMVQECLNRTEAHLWAIVSNGRVLRILRDSSSLTGSSYLEVDLEAMFDGELFEDFVLLYRLLHMSRFELPDEVTAPSACRMEKWRIEAIESGTRFLDDITDGVQAAVIALGTGFLRHPANRRLRDDFDQDQYKRALLRLVYRLLFWFVAEERDLLHAPDVPVLAKERYDRYFSARRLRRASLRRIGGSHGDRWETIQFVLNGLGKEEGRPRLGLPGLGGIYDATDADSILAGLSLSNEYLMAAVKSLSRVWDKSTKRFRAVDYLHLGSEELGAIYQSLLELIPNRTPDGEFVLGTALGNPRKGTGSYYTPVSLVDCLLDSTLDPLLDHAQKRAEVEATRAGTDVSEAVAGAFLSLTVCDPACGSGHFLVAAARRIAKRLAAVREANPEPSVEAQRHALRDVVSRCVYGVDLNPMAVELAKVSLWLEALEPGKPLSFLDAHIKHGNGLIGATPALIEGGIPSGAFKPIEGDDPKFAKSLERANAAQPVLTAGQRRVARFSASPTLPGLEPQSYQEELFSDEIIFSQSNETLAAGLARIAHAPDGSLRDIHDKAAAYRKWTESDEHRRKRLMADAWCAAFVWIKRPDAPPAIVNRVFANLQEKGGAGIPPETLREIERLREEYEFFHWHLEFPDIFHVRDTDPNADEDTGWSGGFTCVLANPPWDKVGFKDQEYFSTVEPSIAALAGQKRHAGIAKWEQENPEEAERYRAARRKVKATFLFASTSGVYPLCAKGLTASGVNALQTDQLFAERFKEITAPAGRIGCIIPNAVALGASAQYLFADLTQRRAVTSLYDFENRKQIFPGIDSRYRFCLLSLTGKALRESAAKFAFLLSDVVELDDVNRVFALSSEDLALINPNTRTLPIFRSRRDVDLTLDIYRRIPVLWDETKKDGNPWGIAVKNLFNMTDDAGMFRTRLELEANGWHLHGNAFILGGKRMLPLYEAKMAHHFDHRWNSFFGAGNDDSHRIAVTDKQMPSTQAMPRYWVAEEGLTLTSRNGKDVKLAGVSERLTAQKWERNWLCGWRWISNATNERTAISAFLPRVAAGNSFPIMLPRVLPALAAALIASQSSLVFDFVSRQKLGGVNMQVFIWKQLPVPTPAMLEPHLPFLVPRVLELVYTAYDMTPLARDLGDNGGPFTWDEDRRALLRAELDAFFFRLYGIDERDDVDYILETFQTETGGLKHNDIAKYGTYRTKDLVLDAYDRMAAAEAAGRDYETAIAPPPGQGLRHPAQAAGGPSSRTSDSGIAMG